VVCDSITRLPSEKNFGQSKLAGWTDLRRTLNLYKDWLL